MLTRFQAALLIVVHVAITGSAIEGMILDERRDLSRQHFRLEAARERVARLQIGAEQAGRPTRLLQRFEQGRLEARPDSSPSSGTGNPPAGPLLRWRMLGGDR